MDPQKLKLFQLVLGVPCSPTFFELPLFIIHKQVLCPYYWNLMLRCVSRTNSCKSVLKLQGTLCTYLFITVAANNSEGASFACF